MLDGRQGWRARDGDVGPGTYEGNIGGYEAKDVKGIYVDGYCIFLLCFD